MTKTDFYITAFSNFLLVVGYLLERVYTKDEISHRFGNILIIFGHVAELITYLRATLEDSVNFDTNQQLRRMNYCFVIATIFCIIGEYQELRIALQK